MLVRTASEMCFRLLVLRSATTLFHVSPKSLTNILEGPTLRAQHKDWSSRARHVLALNPWGVEGHGIGSRRGRIASQLSWLRGHGAVMSMSGGGASWGGGPDSEDMGSDGEKSAKVGEKEEKSPCDFSRMKVTELKEACRDRGLKVSGRKEELVKRLQGGESMPGSVPWFSARATSSPVLTKWVMLPGGGSKATDNPSGGEAEGRVRSRRGKPNLDIESELWKEGYKHVAGVDEVRSAICLRSYYEIPGSDSACGDTR
eukprot:3885981-Rhodomonas_salina.1